MHGAALEDHIIILVLPFCELPKGLLPALVSRRILWPKSPLTIFTAKRCACSMAARNVTADDPVIGAFQFKQPAVGLLPNQCTDFACIFILSKVQMYLLDLSDLHGAVVT